MKKVWIRTTVCLTIFFSLLFIVSAGADNISMEAEVGFNGTYLMDNWSPVRVNLKNTGNNLEGSLEITLNYHDQQKVVYSTPVNLPMDSEKEYTIYVKISGNESFVNINLTDSDGKLVQKLTVRDLRPISTNNYLLGLVTDDQPSLGYWREKIAGDNIFSNYEPVSLDASNFPERREVLSAFSILIFNNINTDAFRPEQLDTLNAWLEDGGVLIIGTGLNGKRTISGLSGSILPVSAGELKELDSPAVLEEFTKENVESVISFQVMGIRAETTKQLLGNEDAGLIWSMQKGNGTVFISAFDLGTEPVLSWPGSRLLWTYLLSSNLPDSTISRIRYPYDYIQSSDNQNMVGVLDNIEAMEMPSVILIFILFLLYLALAGPLNYIFLKKIDKREWSWITIPVLSILFAVLIFGMGYNAKGGELISNTISVVNLDVNDEHGSLTNHIGIFIPRRGDYEVSVDRFAMLAPLYDYSYSGGADAPLAKIVQGNPSSIVFENANIWSMRTFKTDTRQIEMGSINSDLYYEMDKIKGKIQNNTPYPLEHLVIYSNAFFVEVGDIASGESKNVEVNLPVAGGYVYSDIYTIIDSVFPWPSTISYKDPETRRNMTRRDILQSLHMPDYKGVGPVQSMGPGYVWSAEAQSMKISYFAFFEGLQETGILINGRQPDRITGDGVITGTMDLALEKDGMVVIPPGMVTGQFESGMSQFADSGGDRATIYEPKGWAVFSVDLSPYIHLKDLKVQIGINIMYGSGNVFVMDPVTGNYSEVPDNIINIDESSIGKYAGTDGKVYIKIQPGQDQFIEATLPVITLEGRKQ